MSSIQSCGEFLDYDESNVCTEYTGGNDAMILVKQGVTINDTTNQTDVQNAIDAGNAKLISGIKVSIEAPEPVRVDNSRACSPQAVLTYNRTAQIIDGKANATNIDFWNAVDASQGAVWGMAIVHSCAHAEQLIISGNILVLGGLINPLSDEESQQIERSLEWKSKSDPQKETENPIFNA